MAPYKSSAGRNLGKLVKSFLSGSIGNGIEGSSGSGSLSFAVVKPDTSSETIDISSGNDFNFNTTGPYTITATTTGAPVTVDVLMWGAGGSTVGSPGGAGGFSSGKYTFSVGTATYYVVVGAGAGFAPEYVTTNQRAAPIPYGGGGTGAGAPTYNYHGGGFSGLFITDVSHPNALIIAGGGGGAASSHDGGAGGGSTGEDGNGGGSGGTQSAGGAGGVAPGGTGQDGLALQGGGGASAAGGGGGGGLFGGGGGGGSSGQGQQTSGGGGSGYIGGVTSGTTTTGNYGTVANAPSPYRNGAGDVQASPKPSAGATGSPGRVVIGLDLGL